MMLISIATRSTGPISRYCYAGRELNQSRLPPEAQTWINQHFKFTHGYGLALSPVNSFDEEGLPLFYIKDIPPASPMELRIDRPELYFGEQTDTYVVVAGGTTEFDYPKGQENMYTTYQGRDGCHWATCGGGRCLLGTSVT